jgi:DNA polymerase III subunit delta'
MPILPLVGHHDARDQLVRARDAGRLPQVLLISGQPGVGRQRLALWLAQLVLCERPSAEPCGSCRTCRLVLDLAHADVHWFVPIPRPKAADPQKQADEAADALGQIMAERRKNPLWDAPDGMASHALASVRLLQKRASLTAVEGGRRVFIVGHAERMVPQESSPDAANAALKLLEEPPADALVVLTTSDPRGLLPTVRSRAVPIRLGALTDREVRGFLEANLSPRPSPRELDVRVAAAGGSIGAALGQGDEANAARQSAAALLGAAAAGEAEVLERVLKQAAWSARGEFSSMLDALAETLGEAARGATGHEPRWTLPEPLLRPRSAAAYLAAIGHVNEARDLAAGNVNPQLVLAVLGSELGEALG